MQTQSFIKLHVSAFQSAAGARSNHYTCINRGL